MIDLAFILGRVDGLESIVDATRQVCRSVSHFSNPGELPSEFETWPDLVVVIQYCPDEYSKTEIDQLLSRFSVSRVLCCYGPWCASMARTRAYWPPSVTIPMDEFEHRLNLEHEIITGKRPALPITAGLDEIFGFLSE